MESQQLWLTLLLRVAVAASLASILSRFGAFESMLMREDRTLVQRVKLALMFWAMYGSSVLFRVWISRSTMPWIWAWKAACWPVWWAATSRDYSRAS